MNPVGTFNVKIAEQRFVIVSAVGINAVLAIKVGLRCGGGDAHGGDAIAEEADAA